MIPHSGSLWGHVSCGPITASQTPSPCSTFSTSFSWLLTILSHNTSSENEMLFFLGFQCIWHSLVVGSAAVTGSRVWGSVKCFHFIDSLQGVLCVQFLQPGHTSKSSVITQNECIREPRDQTHETGQDILYSAHHKDLLPFKAMINREKENDILRKICGLCVLDPGFG